MAAFVALLLYFFFFFFLEKKKEKRKAEPARGCFASLIGDLTVAGLQLLERRGIFSDVTSGCCVSECLKKRRKKKPTAAQSSTLAYQLRRKERREAQAYITLGRMSVTFQAPEETSDFGGMYF